MIHKLQKFKYLSLSCLLIAVVIAAFKAPYVQIDTNIAQFLHEDDSDFQFYQKVKSELKNNDNLILLGIRSKDSIFSKNFIASVKTLQDSLTNIEGVSNINSIINLKYPARSMFGLIGVPYININDSEITYSKQKILEDELSNSLIGKKEDALLVLIELNKTSESKESERIILDIQDLCNDFKTYDTYLWGRKVIDVSFKNILISEIFKFSFWIFIFLCTSLLLIFKRPVALLFPISLVLVIIVLFLGSLVIINKSLSTLSNLFPTIILIVAISDVIHLCIKYDLESKKGLPILVSTRNTLKEIGWTTLITSFTTAVGFSALYLSPMKAIRNFGIESALLVLITYFLTLVFLPLIFVEIKNKNIFSVRESFNTFSNRVFEIQTKLFEHPKTVLTCFGIILTLTCLGIPRINNNRSHFSIPKETELHESFKFFENNFGGSRTFELILTSKENKGLNHPELLSSVYKIHDFLSSHPKLNSVKSPVNYYITLHRAYYPSSFNKRKLPSDDKTIKKYDREISKFISTDYLSNKSRTMFKFNAQMADYGKYEVDELHRELLNEINLIIGNRPIDARLSGIDFLIDISQKKSIQNTFIGLFIAIIVVSLTLWIIYKNAALALIAVILNLIPLVMTAGIMGFSNMELRAEIALIFTVGFVIAVDDTIHLLSKFQWERKNGKTAGEAIMIAVRDCGKAIIATSIILVGGFFILIGSKQVEIYTLSLLIGIIVLITLFVDLIIAPIILMRWFKKFI